MRFTLQKKRTDLRKSINIGEHPPFDSDSVFTALSEGFKNRWVTFAGSVIETFNSLDRSLVTNDGIRLGSKVILTNVFLPGSWSTNSNSGSVSVLTDIFRIFAVLDAKDSTNIHHCEDLIRSSASDEDGWVSLEYFKVKKFNKGSVHIIFNNKDHIAKLNRIICEYYQLTLGCRQSAASKGLWN